MHGAAAEGTAKGNAADKAVPFDEGIDSDDSQYGGWLAIIASDDSDLIGRRGGTTGDRHCGGYDVAVRSGISTHGVRRVG